MKWKYLKQIFQVGIPAGLQSTVINFSNALCSPLSIPLALWQWAGYTAANNIFGFLYTSVNSVTQACTSFTSQNYGAGKLKRMDKVLVNCLILTVGIPFTLGFGAWAFGSSGRFLFIQSEPDVIACGLEILAIPQCHTFSAESWISFPARSGEWDIRRSDDPFSNWNSWNKNFLDLSCIPCTPALEALVYFLSGILDGYHTFAGGMLPFGKKTGS